MKLDSVFFIVVLLFIGLILVGAESEMERTKVNEAKLWQRDTHQMASVEINKAAIGGVLAPLLSYKFLLPMPQLRAGLAYAGSRARLRRFVRDLIHGNKPLKIGALGGSVTWGQGASNRATTSWFSVVAHWLTAAFPSINITARNGAVPATPASFMVMCLDHFVDPDVDLVFLEYILNNGLDDRVFDNQVIQVMERLIRKLLDLPGKPAVVMMQVPTHSMARYGDGVRFHHTMEDLEGALAQYYDVQYLSLRTALYRLAAIDREDGFLWDQMFVDHHPGDSGHRVMADLVIYMLQDTALDLLLDPWSYTEQRGEQEKPLQVPMYSGNVAPAAAMCLCGDLFSSAVASNASEGFAFVNEGSEWKPRWGYVATQPRARLVMRFDTRRPHLPPDHRVSLYLHYLKSYEHMGVVNLSCTSGCWCDTVEVDAHITEHWSQMYQTRLVATQSDSCEVTLTVLPKTSSGEHKFKVSGAIISEDQSAANMLDGTADKTGRLYLDFNDSS
ncbi:hypothetical protein Vretimale_18816 [Volvox reticuliferus]|uniref:SGNH hydrolase-type esterase domain-containing protein n=1 Tax=Volvox reticuliferus TaxID=1737510 RepID=A0A8J4D298_9CHLO|nr:hypothetical protein Vretifemale_18885 [Volvox reticuliferus]GIM16179.1 hypothetical protein Vretimale_18816 [Volvox reticuliferus]